MKAGLLWVFVGVLGLGVLASSPAAPQVAPTLAPAPPVFSAPELEQLLAPIALYPDELLGQILIAATYPLEVVEAARWRQQPGHAALTGDALDAALAEQDWDPSVKALIPFPQILQMMSTRLDWMQRLGDAFVAQEGDVMDAVQRLRRQAQAAGTLASTPQQIVTDDGETITIEPASPDLVYPPYYNPSQIYGAWPYPNYPPYYFPPPPGYLFGPSLFFGFGVAVIPTLWGWEHVEWRRHRVRIDTDRFNRVDRRNIERRQRPPATQGTWQHDPYHRRGVAYRDPAARERFAKPVPGSPEARRAYRGYDAAAGATPPIGGPAPRVGKRRAATPPARAAAPRGYDAAAGATPTIGGQVPRVGKRRAAAPPAGAAAPRPATEGRRAVQPTAPATPPAAVQQPRPTPPPAVQQPARVPPAAIVQQPRPAPPAAVRQPRPPPSISRPGPPAFEGIARGQDIRSQSSRGQQSLQARPAPVRTAPAPARVAPQGSKAAPQGGRVRGR